MKIVTGSSGLLGSALIGHLKNVGDSIYPTNTKNLNLLDLFEIKRLFSKIIDENLDIKCVYHLAAKVGGVKANIDQPGDFFSDNIMINSNILNNLIH